jgi:glucose/arabinose dehydrogenase
MLALLILAACNSPAAPSSPPAPPSPTAAPPTLVVATATPSPLPPTEPPPSPSPTTAPPTPTTPPTPTALPQPPPLSPPAAIALEPFLDLAAEITYLTHAGDGSGRLFVVEKKGRVRIIDEEGILLDPPFLDIAEVVDASSSEQGLLSIAFPPDFTASGEFYVNYTARASDGGTVIARYRVADGDPNRADPGTAQVVLAFDQPAPNHNGGQIQFGPDGYLYVGTGDGGAAADPWDNAENLNVFLGKMLRLDVRGQSTYAIPPDNPWAGRPVWAYGLRNPWRFSFDRLSGDLYIADVGQGDWEEVNFTPAGTAGGLHFGWDTMEGRHCFEPRQGCETAGKVMPVVEYGHDLGCSITGGYVYRGQRFPALNGVYLFGDYCSGLIWGLWREGGAWQERMLLASDANIASFGEDERGEIYVLDLDGQIYRLLAR